MSNTTAIWSAIAATFSATAAVLLWRIERRKYENLARPELVVAGWSRKSSAIPDVITFNTIENVGSGSALHMHMNAFSIADDDRPTVSMSTMRESLVSPGGKVNVNGEIQIWWNNVAGSPGRKSVPINMKIYCWDTTGIRYLVKYNLHVVEPSGKVLVTDEITQGVMLGTRTIEAEPVWKLKLKQKLLGIPLIGRLFKVK